ncbi:MAG TPA: ABC transporter permease [Candidatus Cybelea sp.]|nr:ABC transporter permease [Candidatus Cybelea sp.]
MSRFSHDLRYAIRMLVKSPGFALVAILTLALAVGANTAIFSAINALLLNPYPFPESDRVVFLDARHVSGRNSATGYRDFLDWQGQNFVFESMAIVPWTGSYTLTGQGEPQRLVGGSTTAHFLAVLHIQPARGRFFSTEEDKPGAPSVVLLSYPAWQRYFGGAADIVGRPIVLDGEPFTVIGVMPRQFIFPGIQTCDFYTALRESASLGRRQHQYEVIARLKPGVTLVQAQGNMTAIAERLAHDFPDTNTGWGIAVLPIRDALVQEARTPSLVLFSIVIFVLLLACANLAGLLLARASGRAKEIAIRASLGAGRLDIMRQLLTESAFLSLAGGSAGLLFANWLMDVLRSAAPQDFGLDSALRLDLTVLAFTLLISLATGIVFGLAPAWYGSKADLNAALKGDAGGGSNARARSRVQSLLVIAQIALSAVLLVGAGLLVRDLLVVLHMQTGLRTEHVLTFGLAPTSAKYSSRQRNIALYQQVIAGLQRAPGVEGAAAVGTLPMTGDLTAGAFEIEGRPKAPDWVDTMVQYNSVTPDYFRTMGIPLLRGRDFNERDTADAMPVAIINDTLARQFFPNDNPIGQRFRDDYDGHWRTIVGISASIKNQQPMKPPIAGLYAPHAQKAWSWMTVVVRTRGDPAKLANTARSIVHATDADLIVLKMRTMKQVVADSMAEPELLASFVAGFAGFALLLAAIGVYGIMAYAVSQRTQEMGIRIALGATRGDILRLILHRGALLATAGIALGFPIALATSRFAASLLYGIGSRDIAVYTAVPLLLVAVSLAATYFPARRAMRVDPMDALRCQ